MTTLMDDELSQLFIRWSPAV